MARFKGEKRTQRQGLDRSRSGIVSSANSLGSFIYLDSSLPRAALVWNVMPGTRMIATRSHERTRCRRGSMKDGSDIKQILTNNNGGKAGRDSAILQVLMGQGPIRNMAPSVLRQALAINLEMYYRFYLWAEGSGNDFLWALVERRGTTVRSPHS